MPSSCLTVDRVLPPSCWPRPASLHCSSGLAAEETLPSTVADLLCSLVTECLWKQPGRDGGIQCTHDHLYVCTNKTRMAPTIMEVSQREDMGTDWRATGYSRYPGSISPDKPRATSAHTAHLSLPSSTLTPRRRGRGTSLSARKRTRAAPLRSGGHANLMRLLCSRDHRSVRARQEYLLGVEVNRTDRTIEQTNDAACGCLEG